MGFAVRMCPIYFSHGTYPLVDCDSGLSEAVTIIGETPESYQNVYDYASTPLSFKGTQCASLFHVGRNLPNVIFLTFIYIFMSLGICFML